MALVVHAYGAYASYDPKKVAWRDTDRAMNLIVKAIKGQDLKGRSYAITDPHGKRFVVDESRRQNAVKVFATWAAMRLSDLGVSKGFIVPVPSSDHLDHNQDFTGWRIATAIEQASGGAYRPMPLLAFRQKMPKASQREPGARNEDALAAALVPSADRYNGPLLLLDDVMTTGAHFRACARVLRGLGAQVETAVCIAKTFLEPAANPFSVEAEDVEAQGSLLFNSGDW